MPDHPRDPVGADCPCSAEARPPYTPPQVILYSEEELLQQLGPARACASFHWDSAPPRQRPAPGGETRFDFEV